MAKPNDFSVRLSGELNDWVRETAETEDRSFSKFIASCVRAEKESRDDRDARRRGEPAELRRVVGSLDRASDKQKALPAETESA